LLSLRHFDFIAPAIIDRYIDIDTPLPLHYIIIADILWWLIDYWYATHYWLRHWFIYFLLLFSLLPLTLRHFHYWYYWCHWRYYFHWLILFSFHYAIFIDTDYWYCTDR
jgi:hypothetical protein